VRDNLITMSSTEFEQIKTQLIYVDAELNRLLAPPLVYATVMKTANKPLGKMAARRSWLSSMASCLKSTDCPT
jgi:hypothetical protein